MGEEAEEGEKSTSVLKSTSQHPIQPTERNKGEGGHMSEEKNDRKPGKVVKKKRETEQKKKKSEVAVKEKQREEFVSHWFSCGLQEVG